VYRGTQLNRSDYTSLLEKNNLINSSKWITMPFNYVPRSNIQSWTTSKQIAVMFACLGQKNDWVHSISSSPGKHWIKSQPFPAIIEASVDESFILSTKLTSKITKAIHDQNEKEIVRIEQSPIQGKAWIHIDWLQAYANMRPNK
jgi:hypothetical protein